LIPLDHPEWFNRRFAQWYAWLLPRLAKRVRRIVTISEFTKRRVIELLGIAPEKIVVIPNGVDASFSPRPTEEVVAVRCELGILSPSYLLYVGSLEPRKNLRRLLEAWNKVQALVPKDIVLVVAGAAGSARVFGSASVDESSPRAVFTGYVADEWLPALYSGALAVIYPSLYEGFGLPPLEAMACGVPVLTSNNTSLPEVAGDGALLIDPHDVNSIAEGIVAVVQNELLREDLARRGLARASQFTWGRTARETLRVLLEEA
jgi:glycosyltransferase involved in cell wall biosynthesis